MAPTMESPTLVGGEILVKGMADKGTNVLLMLLRHQANPVTINPVNVANGAIISHASQAQLVGKQLVAVLSLPLDPPVREWSTRFPLPLPGRYSLVLGPDPGASTTLTGIEQFFDVSSHLQLPRDA